MTRKLHMPIGLILAWLLTIPVLGAMAKDPTAYQAVEFSAAQKQQKHVVIEIFKKGCGTCAAQQPALEKARQQFPDAVFMKVDFEQDANAVTTFKAVKQSTIIIFKGETEVDRLVGVTDPSAILAAIAKGA